MCVRKAHGFLAQRCGALVIFAIRYSCVGDCVRWIDVWSTIVQDFNIIDFRFGNARLDAGIMIMFWSLLIL